MAKQHEHYWCYVHGVYGSDDGSSRVRRWCADCGAKQVGSVTAWRAERDGEFEETPEQAAEQCNAPKEPNRD